MTKTTKQILMFGIPIVLIGGYFIYKAMRGKKSYQNPLIDDNKPTTTTDDGNECKKYIVVVSKGNLNIREEPNTTSKIIGSIPKASEKFAKKTNTEGWMQLCEDGGGFVSSKYLKEVN